MNGRILRQLVAACVLACAGIYAAHARAVLSTSF